MFYNILLWSWKIRRNTLSLRKLLTLTSKSRLTHTENISPLFMKQKFFFFIILIALLTSCNHQKEPISLTWQHIGNDIEPGICESRLTITNISTDTLFADWAIYWNQMSVAPILTEGEQVQASQIQASYHSVAPTAVYVPLPPDSSLQATLRYKGAIMRRSGAPQGAFFIGKNNKPITVPIKYNYSADAQEFRRKAAGFPYADGEEVYKQNERFGKHAGFNRFEGYEQFNCLLPQPKQVWLHDGICNTHKAVFLSEPDTSLPENGYQLIIMTDTIYAFVADMTGLEYARLTLNRLSDEYDGEVPCCEIADWPDTGHRGLMLDIARNFTNKQEIMRIIDLLAAYKMNVLHLHLTDDEGWRIEIPGLPELTEVGARRGFTTDERDCLYPMYSGGWDKNDKTASGNGFLSRNDYIDILRYATKKHISVVPEIDMPGHSRAAIKAMEARYRKYADTDIEKAEEYLLSDFQDTSRYVSAQHYSDNVICIALPSCYRFAQKVIDEVVDMYKEADAPISIFHVGGDEVPRGAWLGSPKVGEYVYTQRISTEAGTYNLPCITPDKPLSAEVTATDVANLKDSFLETIAAMLAEYGLQTAGWEEVAYRNGQPNPRFAGKNILTYAWNSVPEWRGDEKPYKLANAGYPVMICSVCNLYMDMCYLNHEEEAGLNWGGYVDEYCSFDLRPDSLYLSVRRTMRGERRDLGTYLKSGKTSLIADSAKNLRGVQAQLWSETIRDSKQVERYLLPKLLGTAERAWNNSWVGTYEEALNDYNLQLSRYQLPYLHEKGYAFHLSQPGIRREKLSNNSENVVDKSSGKARYRIYMNSAVEGAEIRYTTDGSDPDEHTLLYIEPFETDAELINARCFYLSEKSNCTHSTLCNNQNTNSAEPIKQSTF